MGSLIWSRCSGRSTPLLLQADRVAKTGTQTTTTAASLRKALPHFSPTSRPIHLIRSQTLHVLRTLASNATSLTPLVGQFNQVVLIATIGLRVLALIPPSLYENVRVFFKALYSVSVPSPRGGLVVLLRYKYRVFFWWSLKRASANFWALMREESVLSPFVADVILTR